MNLPKSEEMRSQMRPVAYRIALCVELLGPKMQCIHSAILHFLLIFS